MLKEFLISILSIATIAEIIFVCFVLKIDEQKNKNKLSLSSVSSLIEKKDEFEDYFKPFKAIPKIIDYKMFGAIPTYWLLILIIIGFLFEKMKEYRPILKIFVFLFKFIFQMIWLEIGAGFKKIKSFF